jgi:hypothetical protein
MKTEAITEQLVALTQLPKDRFREYLERATSLYKLLYKEEEPHAHGRPQEHSSSASSAQSDIELPSAFPPYSGETSGSHAPDGVLPRPPMRAPAAGSLREAVYYVLEKEAGAASPKRISQLVAAMRNMPLTENLKASVGEILRHRHDPRIRRIATGLYAIEPRNLAA